MLSVLTIVKNRRQQLCNLMMGLRQSTTPPEELVVVHMDEPAYDNLPAVPFPVRTQFLQANHAGIPLAEARNLAARSATSDLLLFLDVDCIPSAELVEEMAATLRERSALVMSEVAYLPRGAVAEDWTLEKLDRVGVAHPARPRVAPQSFIVPESYTFFWSLSFGIRRSDFVTIGAFDEDYHGYGAEDTDLAFRAREAGLPFIIIRAKAYHQYHPVYRPPVHRFQDIIENARVFYTKWDRWAMESWLQHFADHEYIRWTERDPQLTVLRTPSESEVEACFADDGKGF